MMDSQYNVNSGDVYNLHKSMLSVANYGTIHINVLSVDVQLPQYTPSDIPELQDKIKLAARNMDFEKAAKYQTIIMELSEELQ